MRQHPAKVLPALTAAAGALLAALAVSAISAGVWAAPFVVWGLAAFLILRFAADALNWSIQYIIITEKRLILSSGLFGRRVTVVPLTTLRDLAFARSAGGRLLGYGAFTFDAGSRAITVIDYIPYPEQVYLEVYALLYPDGEDGAAVPGAE